MSEIVWKRIKGFQLWNDVDSLLEDLSREQKIPFEAKQLISFEQRK